MSGTDAPEAPARPVLRIVRGEPTAEELAALTAVVLAAGTRAAAPERPRRSPWGSRVTTLRAMPHPGPGAWRTSTLPR